MFSSAFLFVSRISLKTTQPIFRKFDGKVAHGSDKIDDSGGKW